MYVCMHVIIQVLKFIEEIQKEEEIEQKKAEATTGDM